jgi:ATP-dependent DNA helicase 2 subunit 1
MSSLFSPFQKTWDVLCWIAMTEFFLMLRTSKNVAKNVMLFTNNDDPFGDADASVRQDMRRTTIQRAKDAQDLGIGIDLIPLSRPGEDFNLAIFYSSILKMEVDDEDGAQYLLAAANK